MDLLKDNLDKCPMGQVRTTLGNLTKCFITGRLSLAMLCALRPFFCCVTLGCYAQKSLCLARPNIRPSLYSTSITVWKISYLIRSQVKLEVWGHNIILWDIELIDPLLLTTSTIETILMSLWSCWMSGIKREYFSLDRLRSLCRDIYGKRRYTFNDWWHIDSMVLGVFKNVW